MHEWYSVIQLRIACGIRSHECWSHTAVISFIQGGEMANLHSRGDRVMM